MNSLIPDANLLSASCKYYTAEEVHNIDKKNKHRTNSELKLIHHNIRSLDLHFGELMALLSSLGDNFDFVALSEIGHKNIENRENELKKLGYEFKYKTPILTREGGG